MTVNEQGKPLHPPFKGAHWNVFMALRAEAPVLEKPLHEANDQHVNELLAAYPVAPARTIHIDSTAAGPPILGRLPPSWSREYTRWLDELRHRQPDLPVVDDGQMYGMALPYYLAYTRSERWEMSMKDGRRVYTLLDARGA